MISKKIAPFIFFVLISALPAQDLDIKKLYTDLTTSINSSLLTKQSSIEVSGSISYDYAKTNFNDHESMKSQVLLIDPAISYFIIDNLSCGLSLSHVFQKTEYTPGSDIQESSQTFMGPVIKTYFGSKRVRPFLYADYQFLTGDRYEGNELGLGVGIFLHAAGNFGVSLRFKYSQIWSDKQEIDQQNRILIGLGISNFIL